MKLNEFIKTSDLFSQKELDKITLLAFYHLKKCELNQFSKKDVADWFSTLNLPIPNLSRLNINISKSKDFIRGTDSQHFRLHANKIILFESLFPMLVEKNEEVFCEDSILPESLYIGTRGYIECLAKQINASFESNIFDGCAVLMRRLIEILLIHTYENFQLMNTIKDSNGHLQNLNTIINNAESNSTLDLSRDTKGVLDDFRKIGNFSAHKIYYNCKRNDLKKIILEFRMAFEELLYKSGIKK